MSGPTTLEPTPITNSLPAGSPAAGPGSAAARAAPVTDAERVELIDALRGLALLGILLVNAMMIAHPLVVQMSPALPGYSWLDRAAAGFVQFVAAGKFYSMFSLLFGLGMIVQMERAEARGARFGRLYARRLVILFLIGAVHGMFIWYGDILSTYALIGFLLLLFRRRQPRTVAIWMGVMYALVAIGLVITAALVPDAFGPRPDDELAAFVQPIYELHRHGSYAEITEHRAATFVASLLRSVVMTPLFLGMFLFGVYVAKRRLLHDPAANARALRRLAIAGAVVGLPAAALFVLAEPNGLGLRGAWAAAGAASYMLGGPALCIAYTCGLALLHQRPAWRRRMAYLAPAGQMALTTYLTQSVIFTLICYSYGLGLFGHLLPAAGLALTLAVFAAQVVASRWWLARYRFGPVEWLWRSLTYRAWQPMRRAPRPALVHAPDHA